jgi:hypothetical protein
MKVAIALFPRNTSVDAIGPYETLQRVPSIDVVFVGHRRGEVRSHNGMLGLTCDAAFDEVTEPDVVIFPGGIGTRTLISALRASAHRCFLLFARALIADPRRRRAGLGLSDFAAHHVFGYSGAVADAGDPPAADRPWP